MTAALTGYGPELLGYLAAVLRHEDLAQKVFAEACERIWKGLSGFRQASSFRVWAYRVVWNAAAQHMRGRSRRREQGLASAELEALVASVRESTRPTDKTSVRAAVHALREQLPPEEQTLLTLRLDRGLSWREIGEVVGTADEVALRKRFERLKKRMRELARQEGLLGAS